MPETLHSAAIKVFATGGSIDKGYSVQESDFVVGEPAVKRMLHEGNVHLPFEVESLLKKDSLDITDDDRRAIVDRVRADPHRRILITHGTDTMIETALALCEVRDKVIVLTGAMQPAAFKRTDAALNVGGALIAMQTLPEGVYVVMNGRVFDPRKAVKNRKLERFEETGDRPSSS